MMKHNGNINVKLEDFRPRMIVQTLDDFDIEYTSYNDSQRTLIFDCPIPEDICQVYKAEYYWQNALSVMWQAKAYLAGGCITLHPISDDMPLDERMPHKRVSVPQGSRHVRWNVSVHDTNEDVLSEQVSKFLLYFGQYEPETFFHKEKNLVLAYLYSIVKRKDESGKRLDIPLAHIRQLKFRLLHRKVRTESIDSMLDQFLKTEEEP